MHFYYNDMIFKYPTVQYIPLQIIDLKEIKYDLDLSTRFYIYLYEENDELNERLKRYEIKSPYNIKEGEFAIFLINGMVELVKYRAYEVLMVGKREKGMISLFKLKDKYFYKDKIFITLYDGQTAEKIDRDYLKK